MTKLICNMYSLDAQKNIMPYFCVCMCWLEAFFENCCPCHRLSVWLFDLCICNFT